MSKKEKLMTELYKLLSSPRITTGAQFERAVEVFGEEVFHDDTDSVNAHEILQKMEKQDKETDFDFLTENS